MDNHLSNERIEKRTPESCYRSPRMLDKFGLTVKKKVE